MAGTVEADDATAPNLADVPFTLRDQRGEEFSSSQLEGKVWMGAIFFANCPGPCFRENQEIADILRRIDDRDFRVVSLTCDPENDTSEA
ncbi:MAG: SCO family protein, partial [Pirellulales bacterium]